MRSLALLLLAAPVAAFQPSSLPTRVLGRQAQISMRPGNAFRRPAGLSMKLGEEQPAPRQTSKSSLAGLRTLLPAGMKTALFALAALSPLASLTAPSPAEAASSGGRAGGSSFRSRSYSSPSRSYSSPSRSYSSPSTTRRYAAPSGGVDSYTPSPRSYSRSPTFVPVPVPVMPYSPYVYGGSGYGVIQPFGVMRVFYNLIIAGGVVYLVASVLKSAGGSKWDQNEDEPSSLGSGVTVLKLQVGLQVPERDDPASILQQLDTLASKANVRTRGGLAKLVQSTSLALLRCSNDWVSATGESQSFGSRQGSAESEFSRLAMRERSKFDREEDMMEQRSVESSPYSSSNTPTLAVVTLCVAIRGQKTKVGRIDSVASLKAALQNVGADAMTDEGDNVLACEVLWTPQSPGDVLSKRDLITDYPELRDI